MRFTNKYKLYGNLSISTKRLPEKKLNKFYGPKWLKVKTRVAKYEKKYSVNPKSTTPDKFDKEGKNFSREKRFSNLTTNVSTGIDIDIDIDTGTKGKEKEKENLLKKSIFTDHALKNVSTKSIIRIKNRHRIKLETRKYLSSLFDNSIDFKIEKSLKIREKILAYYLLRPYYRLDLLLWSLDYFGTSFESRQKIITKKILVNGKIGKSNQYLKKGDVISFSIMKGKEMIKNNFLKNNKFYRKNCSYFPFLEIDYYSNQIIIIKDLDELSFTDYTLLIEEPIHVTKAYK